MVSKETLSLRDAFKTTNAYNMIYQANTMQANGRYFQIRQSGEEVDDVGLNVVTRNRRNLAQLKKKPKR